jgi:hypothetical protein
LSYRLNIRWWLNNLAALWADSVAVVIDIHDVTTALRRLRIVRRIVSVHRHQNLPSLLG